MDAVPGAVFRGEAAHVGEAVAKALLQRSNADPGDSGEVSDRRGSRCGLQSRMAPLPSDQGARHRKIDMVGAELTESNPHVCAELQIAVGYRGRCGDIESSLPAVRPREHVHETRIIEFAQERTRFVHVSSGTSYERHRPSMTSIPLVRHRGRFINARTGRVPAPYPKSIYVLGAGPGIRRPGGVPIQYRSDAITRWRDRPARRCILRSGRSRAFRWIPGG
jgi:hypothetical protein